MKFKHQFVLKEKTDTSRTYHADSSTVRLDFMEHMLRVAILRDQEPVVPTYTIRPRLDTDPGPGEGLASFPREGRDKLSTEGFVMETPQITEDEDSVSILLDGHKISIDLFNFKMQVENEYGILYHDRDYISYNFDHELGDGSCHYITREPHEHIFGLGDKTGSIDKNKRRFTIAASDAMGFDSGSSDPLYKQLPFYICENSVGSYGIYYDTYSNGEMNFGCEINNYYAPYKYFRCEEENLVFYLIFGNVPEIVNRFSKLCGPLVFPPKWSFSYCGSTMSYTDASDADARLRGFIDLCEMHELHPGGFYLSSGYTQIGNKRYVFHWNTDKIPSPEGLARYFSEHKVAFIPNVKPAFLVNHPLYQQIASKGWFLHYADGTPAIFPFWDDYGSYLDFTNPKAYDFWRDCVKEQLVDKGYKNIWNDNNEYDILDKEVMAHGWGREIPAHLIRPLFSFLMTMESLEAQDTDIRTMSVSRCGIGGLGRIASTWTGDNNTSFTEFRGNHHMAMTMSLSGFYNFGQDIGGFAGPCPDVELFLRWIQYGIFTPRFVLHSWNSDGSSTMPWLYPEKMDCVKKLFALRDSLVPYLYNEMFRSINTGDPIIYPLFLKHPHWEIDSDQFYCGDAILSCPIFDQGATAVSAKLPPNNGGWYGPDDRDLLQWDYYEGNTKATLSCTPEELPVYFIKGGSILPWAWSKETLDTGRRNAAAIDFTLYPLDEGCFTWEYLDDNGVDWLTEENHEVIRFTVRCDASAVTVSAVGKISGKPIDVQRLKLHLVDHLNRQLVIEYL